MRRAAAAIALAAAVALVPAAPASADFHGLCTGGGSAAAELVHSGGELTWRGRVVCPGTTIRITSLVMRRHDESVADAGPAECAGCETLVHSGSEPAGPPGYYQVELAFSVTRGTSTARTGRVGRFHWPGAGNPVPVDSWRDFCDAYQAQGASVSFANDNGDPLAPRIVWGGSVTCAADEILFDRLSVRNNATGQTHDAAPFTCEPCPQGLTASARRPTLGPGTYTVDLRFGIRRGGVVFYPVTVTQTSASAGAGPVLTP